MEYTGTVAKCIYSVPGFTVFRFRTSQGEFTALGKLDDIREGEKLYLRGSFENHPKFGRQLKIESWEKIIPTDRDEAVELLSSGIVKGVGPATARKIVDALGPGAVEKILENPDVLNSIKGLGKKAPKIARSIMETYSAQRAVKELVSFGMTVNAAQKIYRAFGRQAPELVKLNPYCLTEVDGMGFLKADEIAQKIGVKRDSRFRVEAGVLFILNEALWKEGHTYLPVEKLLEKTLALLNKEYDCVTREQVLEALNHSDIKAHTRGISLAWAYRCEKDIAENIGRLRGKLSAIDPEPVIACFEKAHDITLTPGQREAVKMAVNSGLSILTGGPGVGKTATVRAVVHVFEKLFPGKEIRLAAPTGRAARRMAEVTGKQACTVHRLLGIDRSGKPAFNRNNPLDCGLLIIDETSMMDCFLARNVLNAVKKGTRVLFVGDPDQLPSVGPGSVLKDILSSSVPKVTLTEVFRQAAESQIITNAHRINRGLPLLIDRSRTDLFFIEKDEPEEIARSVVTWAAGLSRKGEDVQVLSPKKDGFLGTWELNRLIQEAVNPAGREIKYGNQTFRVGDRVIQTRNNYEKYVFNGDIGVIKRIGSKVEVQFNGDVVPYSYDELWELELAYCISVHRSQGSEFGTVIVPVSTSHYFMLARNLLYTAVSRAKKRLVLVGSKKALAMAIKNDSPVKRYTMLGEFLNAGGTYW
ncbi:exodeoxyribonuclease V alpha subunit [Desulfofundulus australicus DSM 11792]|uniref:ATP-dependent RecD2 DNA helicase n=1 Tax=Desulfofundulus australicus DSM 11792 TaxID=1121425 RepID=A0A1M5CMJ1_9FIRM|nr:ATP-dependent RecD-like DNA helicase [Desulfofundulus australicus]SHF55930.1 exodeoxyribonuclease V alpha subunit [Desulfofundulus australicus DSM 11792]